MSTYQPVTTSSSTDFPTDPETLEAIQSICDDYVFGTGPCEETIAEVREGIKGEYHLYIGGHAEFDPVVRKDKFPGYDPVSGEAEEYWTDERCQIDQETTVEFLQRLSRHLNDNSSDDRKHQNKVARNGIPVPSGARRSGHVLAADR